MVCLAALVMVFGTWGANSVPEERAGLRGAIYLIGSSHALSDSGRGDAVKVPSQMRMRRGRQGGTAPAIVEARLTPVAATTGVSDRQYLNALDAIRETGVVPKGWKLSGVRWGHFTVKGEETDAFRFTHWQAGEAIDLQAFPPDLFRRAVVGIERIEGETREVVTTREVVEVERIRGPRSRWHSIKTGAFVKDAYARRYPHLVELDHVTERRVRRLKKVRRRVPVEEAVIRFTYAAQFTIERVQEIGA